MKINKYLSYLMKDFFTACGCLMIITTILLSLYSANTINTSSIWQIILVAAACTFFKVALVNNYELSKKAQLTSFFIGFTMADVMIVLLLCSLSPGKSNDMYHIISYIIILLIVKGLVYMMIYTDGRTQAKQLNEKLREYNNEINE